MTQQTPLPRDPKNNAESLPEEPEASSPSLTGESAGAGGPVCSPVDDWIAIDRSELCHYADDCSSLNEFFHEALEELLTYSRQQGFQDWSCPEPDIVESGDSYRLHFNVDNVEAESVSITREDGQFVVFGMRWATPPGKTELIRIPFRRVTLLEGEVDFTCWEIKSLTKKGLVIRVAKRDTVAPPAFERTFVPKADVRHRLPDATGLHLCFGQAG